MRTVITHRRTSRKVCVVQIIAIKRNESDEKQISALISSI